jgi:hypothetical protein
LAASLAVDTVIHTAHCGLDSGVAPVLAFEFARNGFDLAAALPQRCAEIVDAQRTGLWIDVLAFVPLYTGFIALAGVAARRIAPRLAWAAIVMVVCAAICDQIENRILLGILAEQGGPVSIFGRLSWAVGSKFALLAASEVVLGASLFRLGWPLRLFALAMIGGGLVALAMLFVDPLQGAMMAGHKIALFSLFFLALIAAFRPALAAAHDRA